MTGVLAEVYLYKGSDVDNKMANYLIDVVYREKKLFLINTECGSRSGNNSKILRKFEIRNLMGTE
jgi:hypothetical protein